MQPELKKVSIDDTVLVQKCQRGDSLAMEHLIVKYQARIYNVILKICANPDDAAELTQDAFVKVLENITGFKGKSSFYTWLFRIAVNLTISFCKRNVRLGFRSMEIEIGQNDAKTKLQNILVNQKADDPSKNLQNTELREIIIAALMKLDSNHRTVIVLRDIEAMTYEQIAEVVEIELGTVKSRISRARSNFRMILEKILK